MNTISTNRILSTQLLLFLLLSFLVGPIFAHESSSTRKERTGSTNPTWYDSNRFSLHTDSGRDDQADWIFNISQNGDIRIEANEKYQDKAKRGQILFISQRAMLTKGLDLKPGYEIDAMDRPGLILQLTAKLLGQAFKNGPSSVTKTHTVTFSESTEGIKVSTTSATGHFSAPWSLSGVVTRVSQSRINFDIVFTFKKEGGPIDSKIPLRGSWEKLTNPMALSDDMSLDEWKVYFLGSIKKSYKGNTVYDYGASPSDLGIRRLGELRTHSEQEKEIP